MLLAIDIGNTSITIGVVKKEKVIKSFLISSTLNDRLLDKRLRKLLKCVIAEYPAIQLVVICSVVPKVLKSVIISLKKYAAVPVRVIGKDLIVPIKNNYLNPDHVGQDRLVCAYAAKHIYGYPAIVIDFGTAITFDFISAKGAYEGGLIVPGIQMSADSLFKKTALLPNITSFHRPSSLIGKTTGDSILSGIFNGYGAMSDGLIQSISKKSRKKPKVVLTGGYTELIRKFITYKNVIIDKNLVMKGIVKVFLVPHG